MESFKSFGNVLQFLIEDWRHQEKIQNFGYREKNTAQKSKSQQSGHLNSPLFHQSALSPVGLQAPRLTVHFKFWPCTLGQMGIRVGETVRETTLPSANSIGWLPTANSFG